jgi:hypothetical protein
VTLKFISFHSAFHINKTCIKRSVPKAGLSNLIDVVTKVGLTNLIDVVTKAGLTVT